MPSNVVGKHKQATVTIHGSPTGASSWDERESVVTAGAEAARGIDQADPPVVSDVLEVRRADQPQGDPPSVVNAANANRQTAPTRGRR